MERNVMEIQPIKILVVDDESDVEHLITRRLQKKLRTGEPQFLFAANGVEALETLPNHPHIAVALIDINMPHMDGLSFLSHLKEHYPFVCPIIVSAYDDMKNIRTSMNLGAYEFLTKPLDLNNLEITLDKAIRHVTGIIQNVTERKQAEEALSKERKLLRTLIDAMPDFIYVKDPQGRFVLNKRASIRALGSPPEVVGKTDFDFFPEELAEQYFADEQKILQSGQPLINREERNLNR